MYRDIIILTCPQYVSILGFLIAISLYQNQNVRDIGTHIGMHKDIKIKLKNQITGRHIGDIWGYQNHKFTYRSNFGSADKV